MALPIAILGSGVSALTTALTLRQRPSAPDVVLYAPGAGAAPGAASLVAPALFTPYPPTPAEADSPAFRRRTEVSFREFARLAGQPGVSAFVRISELREYLYKPASDAPEPRWLGPLLHSRPITAPHPVLRATTSTRPHIDMDGYMPWLNARALAAGVVRVDSAAPTFDAIFARGHGTIINCTGLGSRMLARDALLRPMHGQVLHVPNDIGLAYSLHDDAPDGQVAYVFNFGKRLILGGTFEVGRESSGTDEPALSAIVERCRNLLRLDGHPGWADLGRVRTEVRAAARPCRGTGEVHEDIRLERVDLPHGRRIVHNYGHGRTGVTLSWGCAAEAADLALGG